MSWWKFWTWFTPGTADDIDTPQEILESEPEYFLPSLDFVVGPAPAPPFTDLGGGVVQLKFLKTKLQPAIWAFLRVNEHFVVNLQKCTSGLIVGKSEDATYCYLKVQLKAGNTWDNGDPLVPQTNKFVLHFSHLKFARFLARDRDHILGWRDDGTWGLLRQAAEYDPEDAGALGLPEPVDLNAALEVDLQVLTATGRVVNVCRSDAKHKPMSGLSDGLPPFEIRKNVPMTAREVLELHEVMRAQQRGGG